VVRYQIFSILKILKTLYVRKPVFRVLAGGAGEVPPLETLGEPFFQLCVHLRHDGQPHPVRHGPGPHLIAGGMVCPTEGANGSLQSTKEVLPTSLC